jgi:sialate O-acetylesterase
MIKCWRNAWGQGDFPFYYVQIAPYNYDEEMPGPSSEVREAQLMALQVPNTGMIVTTDIGNPVNIHPSNKQDVGGRLALWALAKTYGMDSVVYSGPLYDTISIEGSKAIVHFKYAESGLIAKNGTLTHFEVAGVDQVYYPANAEIKGQTVEVTCLKVKAPVAVRFGWNQIAEPNLYNSAGLPASPFRTDNWKRLSE